VAPTGKAKQAGGPVFKAAYHFQQSKREAHQPVCHKVFVSLLAGILSESRIRRLSTRAKAGHAPTVDRRGGAHNVIADDVIENVHAHVCNQTILVRHYSNTPRFSADMDKTVLGPECRYAFLYDTFIKVTQPAVWAAQTHLRSPRADVVPVVRPTKLRRNDPGVPAIGITRFTKELRTLNYRRGAYVVDRCARCTVLWSKIDAMSPTQLLRKDNIGKRLRKQKRRLLEKYVHHLDRAEHAKQAEKHDRWRAQKLHVAPDAQVPLPKCSVEGVMHIRTDQGSGQPTPKLGGGPSHFLSQSTTNSLYIVCASREKQCFAFYWETREGKSGPTNLASAFMYFLEHYNLGRTHLIIWADNTPKGTKNWVWLKLARWLVREGWFKTVDLKFYIAGHTYMPGFGPDACHNTFLKAAGKGDKCHVHDYLDAARTVRNGGWVVVHLKASMHFNIRAFLNQWYKQGPSKAFNMLEFHWYNVGEGEDREGNWAHHDGIWARHSHYPKRFFFKINVDKTARYVSQDLCLEWNDRRWWVAPPKLKKNAFTGIVKSMCVMDARTRKFWMVVFERMFGSRVLEKALFQALRIDDEDEANSSDTDETFEQRVRARALRRENNKINANRLALKAQSQKTLPPHNQ
jgi:hypothetical protein